jgi:uncharacterized protein YlxW (UPF0749 family)
MSKVKDSKIIASRSLIAIALIAVGILIMAQVRSIPERLSNPVASYSSLKETKQDLYNEQNELKKEIQDLQKNIDEEQNSIETSVLSKDQKEALNYKKAQAGLTKLNGKGIIIDLADSTSDSSEDSIVHAADIRDIVNLLWSSGAEGVSINDHRIVLNTAIDCIVNTILINSSRISNPFKIEAVGNQSLMYEKIINRDYLKDLWKRSSNNGIKFNIRKNNDITLPVFDGAYDTNGVSN